MQTSSSKLGSFISLVRLEGDLNSTVPCSRLGVHSNGGLLSAPFSALHHPRWFSGRSSWNETTLRSVFKTVIMIYIFLATCSVIRIFGSANACVKGRELRLISMHLRGCWRWLTWSGYYQDSLMDWPAWLNEWENNAETCNLKSSNL